MKEVSEQQALSALETSGVRPGDRLLVHSAVQFLGKPTGGVGMYLDALQTAIGPSGTVAVPAFNFAFARGEPFDPLATPSTGMGVFSEYVRQQPGALRTAHPMQSLAVLGMDASDLAGRDTPSAFDPGSAFERLLDLDYKILLLGADVNAISLVHYSEQRLAVPYRYWKEFTGRVSTPDGWEERTYRMYVRDQDSNPRLDLRPVQRRLESNNQWWTTRLNYGWVSVCRARDFVAATDALLAGDPWALVANREQAIQALRRESL